MLYTVNKPQIYLELVVNSCNLEHQILKQCTPLETVCLWGKLHQTTVDVVWRTKKPQIASLFVERLCSDKQVRFVVAYYVELMFGVSSHDWRHNIIIILPYWKHVNRTLSLKFTTVVHLSSVEAAKTPYSVEGVIDEIALSLSTSNNPQNRIVAPIFLNRLILNDTNMQ